MAGEAVVLTSGYVVTDHHAVEEIARLRAALSASEERAARATAECERLAERTGECHRDMTLALADAERLRGALRKIENVTGLASIECNVGDMLQIAMSVARAALEGGGRG